MYQLKNLLERWEANKPLTVDDCIKDIKLTIATLTNLNYHPKGLDDVIRFGKYKDKKVIEIIDLSPTYFNWCIENMNGFMLDEEAFNYMLSKENEAH